MKKLSFLSLLIGAVLAKNDVYAATPLEIINPTGREYPNTFIYVGKLHRGSVLYPQVISKKEFSVNTSIYSEVGHFKGMRITVVPAEGTQGPRCHIASYPDISTPVITIIDSTTCTITSPLEGKL